jgi:superfamily II DNA or RNA helicase
LKKIRFLLKAPTGAGKTLMLSEIIRKYLAGACVLVLSPGAGNLEEQTEKAIRRNLSGTDITVSGVDSLVFTSPAPAGSVFVKNWESLCGKDRKTGEYKSILARDAETKNVFDWIGDTVSAGVPLVIIIDEAHYGNEKDETSINEFLNRINDIVVAQGGYSPVVIEATATPEHEG